GLSMRISSPAASSSSIQVRMSLGTASLLLLPSSVELPRGAGPVYFERDGVVGQAGSGERLLFRVAAGPDGDQRRVISDRERVLAGRAGLPDARVLRRFRSQALEIPEAPCHANSIESRALLERQVENVSMPGPSAALPGGTLLS